MRRPVALIAAALALALAAAGCGGGSSSSSGGGSSAGGGLPLKHADELTVGIEPYGPPFQIPPLDHPTGYEIDVVKAIAKELKAPPIHWVRVNFNNLFSPAPTAFDFAIDNITVTPQRSQVVDFSRSYFDANQALLVRSGTPAAQVDSIAGMKDLKLGAQATTTGLSFIKDTIQPSSQPREYPKTSVAFQALKVGQIDGVVVDLPIALDAVKKFGSALQVVGQMHTDEHFGILFRKGSALRAPVDRAIGAIQADGTLKRLQDRWFPSYSDIPVLQ